MKQRSRHHTPSRREQNEAFNAVSNLALFCQLSSTVLFFFFEMKGGPTKREISRFSCFFVRCFFLNVYIYIYIYIMKHDHKSLFWRIFWITMSSKSKLPKWLSAKLTQRLFFNATQLQHKEPSLITGSCHVILPCREAQVFDHVPENIVAVVSDPN